MHRRKVVNAVWIILVILSCLGYPLTHSLAKGRKIANGTWGGDQINVTVEDDSATIEYSCANGKIKGPLILDSNGRFKLSGTHTAGHGGPTRADEIGNARPALYTGTVKGRTMNLTVKLTDTNETVGTFILILGKQGKLFRCV